MYCLAEKNPNITIDFIAQRTKLSKEIVEPAILKMASAQLVSYDEKNKGCTLTPTGLAGLYVFHKEYVENN